MSFANFSKICCIFMQNEFFWKIQDDDQDGGHVVKRPLL